MPPPTRVLMTGFEPFGGAASNSSWDAVRLLASRWDSPISLVTACLPVTFGSAIDDLLAEHSPDVVIAVGLAAGRAAITPERVALNLIDARIPDNDGARPIDEPVIPGGPAAYFSGLPVKAMVDRMRTAGLPAEVSQTAGTFVCNEVMYRLMRAAEGTGIRAGFIHVPASPALAEGTALPFLPVEDIARGLGIAAITAVELDRDERLGGGAES